MLLLHAVAVDDDEVDVAWRLEAKLISVACKAVDAEALVDVCRM